ncbi:MAG TPA: CHASE3 domain-containing protein, partial [Tepidisphaeraceae bacterium]|nr:CHASE3 domain-containing protein [Tepidisphaeraceae bacterium]
MPPHIEPRRFRQLLKWVILPPLAMMVLLAAILFWQVTNLLHATALVEHSDDVIAQANVVLRSMLNMETGQRGFLMTGDPQFLEPYDMAGKSIDADIARLKNLVADNQLQSTHLREIEKLSLQWRQFAADTISDQRNGKPAGIMVGDLTGKKRMDALRVSLAGLIDEATQQRDQRSRATQGAVLTTLIASGGLTLFLGIVLSLNSRRQFVTMANTYGVALSVAAEEAAARREGEEHLRQMADARERYAQQLQELAIASIAVNSALSIEEAMRRVTEFARKIIGANQGMTSLTADQNRKLSEEIYALMSKMNKPMRLTQAELEAHPAFKKFKDSISSAPMRGWLAAPLIGRDGMNIGMIQLSDKYEGDFNVDDEAILVQLGQMASVAIENGQYYKATQEARLEAENANRLKDQFLATLSHELRTPLNAILGWSQLLRTMDLSSEEGQQGLETIERNARAQTQLIADLLDVSRIISGKLRLDVQAVNLPELIAAGLGSVQPAADAKSLRIEQIIDPSAGPVIGDPARLQQVVWNLLSNAVKFTPKNGKVNVKLARINSHVEISVTDSGEGISPEFL